jgi:hypothetical protein
MGVELKYHRQSVEEKSANFEALKSINTDAMGSVMSIGGTVSRSTRDSLSSKKAYRFQSVNSSARSSVNSGVFSSRSSAAGTIGRYRARRATESLPEQKKGGDVEMTETARPDAITDRDGRGSGSRDGGDDVEVSIIPSNWQV